MVAPICAFLVQQECNLIKVNQSAFLVQQDISLLLLAKAVVLHVLQALAPMPNELNVCRVRMAPFPVQAVRHAFLVGMVPIIPITVVYHVQLECIL
jgi:hypothetical protein